MTKNTLEKFDECKITEAHVKMYNQKTDTLSSDKATKLGCTGKIELSSEYKTIVKNCEGLETKKVKKLVKLTGNISAHMPLAIARTVFGLSNKGLKDGVYAIDDSTDTPNMCLTAKAIDLFTDEEKYMCLPKISFSTGFIKTIDNTADQVAEISLNFDAYKDENGKFYYESCASEVEDANISTKWLEEFTPTLVKATTN